MRQNNLVYNVYLPSFKTQNIAMEYTQKIKAAIHMAIRVHELDQKQKRKGKDIPYIIHPLIVGLILSRISHDEDIIVAGLLHDTVEDSLDTKKVTVSVIKRRFGAKVARIVSDVTESKRELPWVDHKSATVKKLSVMAQDSLLVKSADVIANCTELLADFRKEGDSTFRRFNVPKDHLIQHYVETIEELIRLWPDHPLRKDLDFHLSEVRGMYGMY